ncbi:hypothetical protein HG530_003870 [Fusarium avenaceum]|nr:hypothetical protein HG530_003870 [Fusarium avenaceum]
MKLEPNVTATDCSWFLCVEPPAKSTRFRIQLGGYDRLLCTSFAGLEWKGEGQKKWATPRQDRAGRHKVFGRQLEPEGDIRSSSNFTYFGEYPLGPVPRGDGNAVMRQLALHVAALDADAGLAHDLCALADPDHQDELDPRALLVVGVLDAHVAVLHLPVVELAHHLAQTARARLGELQLVSHRAGVRDEQPVGRILV